MTATFWAVAACRYGSDSDVSPAKPSYVITREMRRLSVGKHATNVPSFGNRDAYALNSAQTELTRNAEYLK